GGKTLEELEGGVHRSFQSPEGGGSFQAGRSYNAGSVGLRDRAGNLQDRDRRCRCSEGKAHAEEFKPEDLVRGFGLEVGPTEVRTAGSRTAAPGARGGSGRDAAHRPGGQHHGELRGVADALSALPGDGGTRDGAGAGGAQRLQAVVESGTYLGLPPVRARLLRAGRGGDHPPRPRRPASPVANLIPTPAGLLWYPHRPTRERPCLAAPKSLNGDQRFDFSDPRRRA